MSTAGKVLTVLSALMLVVWIVMISAVAQLNMNAGQQRDKLKKDVETIREDVTKTEQNAIDLRDKVNDEQVSKERELRLVRIRLSTAERQLTEARDELSRVRIQVENYGKSLASSQDDLAKRLKEKADLEQAKADGEALVTRLQGENATLLDQLTKLRTDFQTTLKRNADEVKKGRTGTLKSAGRVAAGLAR